MPVDRPMFVVGPPRSGTSLLYRCLASHPDVGFFNRANGKFTRFPRLAHLLTRLGAFSDHPRESRKIWFWSVDGPYSPMEPEFETDVRGAEGATPALRAFYDRLITDVLRLRGARRLASKLPAHSLQIPFLGALFPDALFVHSSRDWRAVVSSTIVKRRDDFGGRWFGVCPPGWREAAKLPPEVGAAWQLLWAREELERQGALSPGRHAKVQYEELCAEPSRVLEGLFGFVGLRWNAEAKAALPKDLGVRPDKWREHLTDDMVRRIEAEFDLRRFEFCASRPE